MRNIILTRNCIQLVLAASFIFFIHAGTFSQSGVYPHWKHYSIDAALPGSAYGTGGPALADFDNDGDLDVAVSRRNPKSAFWYSRVNDSIWIPHLMGTAEPLASTLGTTPLDIDLDGWIDVAFQGVWFKNPGVLAKSPDTPWKINYIKAGGHDATTADIDGNGKNDILIYDGITIAWYNTSDKLKEIIISTGYSDHGGVAPHGFGDIDGDGDRDVVIPGFWFVNPGDQSTIWKRNDWPFDLIPDASYGRSIRSWIADINNDGNNDIVYSHCDTGGSHVYWVENKGKGSGWVSHQLNDPPVAPGNVRGTGSFHSLIVMDFNQDGTPDIFAGEQEDPDTYMEAAGKRAMKPRGLKPRGVIWYNRGKSNPQFDIYVINTGFPGWHDAQAGDIDNDGDIDIVSKIWNTDGPSYHLDLWRNELKK